MSFSGVLIYIRSCAGVFACDYIEETGNATKDEECGVVDEEKALAGRVPTESTQLREATLGCNAWGG